MPGWAYFKTSSGCHIPAPTIPPETTIPSTEYFGSQFKTFGKYLTYAVTVSDLHRAILLNY
eukprot:4596665-Amphidinium_carterae.1